MIIKLKDLYADIKDQITIPHRSSFYQIVYFKEETTHLIDFDTVSIEKDTLLFLNNNTVHAYGDISKNSGCVIIFSESFFHQSESDAKFLKNSVLFCELLSVYKFSIKPQEKDTFKSLIEMMQKELSGSRDSSHNILLKNYLHNFLLYSERIRNNQHFRQINRGQDFNLSIAFRNMLESEYRVNKQVSTYASQLAISERQLNRISSAILGKTAKQMIDYRIMLEAKRLLTHSDDSVKEIGIALGFIESTHFTKYFKKHNRTTPIEFRKLMRVAAL
ncbi:helix-turn-helix domain-containing protein [Chryseobacterium sp. M5]|uniref:helix-turn-helix domain-containing protein n=1 Tax=Chryseobacterium sp. M5 TaxID=3379128 RepID=UPI00385770D8